jgi:hypothetical protein
MIVVRFNLLYDELFYIFQFPLASAPAHVEQTIVRIAFFYFFSQFPDASAARPVNSAARPVNSATRSLEMTTAIRTPAFNPEVQHLTL